ncbi:MULTISPECIES: DUF4332 domain-containing protein [Synechococcaceae]|uniref:DUF4332 domain-containing protein n=1 Tax=Synechococcaceae TaxID=1890426 RepID=UPI000A7B51DB|nr:MULTISPECIES: DUF4332 domain-containing protein [Synechococcaceae]MCT4367980.1 DUF4332 domain-containing protein [Candidatus Regnicoccus frigidus MAG-AL2]TWB88283.1 uncharacterized protein DUF4332 [Synechococcus sp. Ace-Pa]
MTPTAIGTLPLHFQAEQRQLELAGHLDWQSLAQLSDAELRRLARNGASEQRLIKLRGQAQLIVAIGLAPPDAALLLYAGIATADGLAQASPQQLVVQLGRLQRSLTGTTLPMVSATTVRQWISAARRSTGRSPN